MKGVKNLNIQILIIVLITLGISVNISAQHKLSPLSPDISAFTFQLDYKLKLKDLSSNNLYSGPVLRQSNRFFQFYQDQLGVFCKAENKIQDVSKIPFKFRLGSAKYVDWLESKPNSSFHFR